MAATVVENENRDSPQESTYIWEIIFRFYVNTQKSENNRIPFPVWFDVNQKHLYYEHIFLWLM